MTDVTITVTKDGITFEGSGDGFLEWSLVNGQMLREGLGIGQHLATWNEERQHLELEDRSRWLMFADDLGKTNADRTYVEAFMYSEGVRCRPPRTVTGVAVGASGSSGG